MAPSLLFVDDEPHILSALRRVFRREAYEIHTAGSGAEALEILRTTRIDLLVSDQRMPGMSGTELLEEAKRLWPDTLRLILSGYTDFKALELAINRAEIYRFLAKPWEDDDLRRAIAQALTDQAVLRANRQAQQVARETSKEWALLIQDLQDVTTRRAKELTLTEEVLDLHRAILEALPCGLVGFDQEGCLVLLNGQAQALLGQGGKALLGGSYAEGLPAELLPLVEEVIRGGHAGTRRTCRLNAHAVEAECVQLRSGGLIRGGLLTLATASPEGERP